MSISSSLKGSSRQIKGSAQCSSASSAALAKSLFGVEFAGNRNNRIERSLRRRKPGDMIRIERAGFLHYAIYIGRDKVVDFVADDGGEVSSRNLFETVGSSECAVDNYLDKERRPYTEQEIVQRALHAIVEDHKYSLGKYNCEHFATWCRYGYKYCHQPCEVAATLGAIADLF